MDSVRKAQNRLKVFPQLLADCGGPAISYAKCVVVQENLKQNACLQEFNELRKCIHKAARKIGTRV